MEANLRKALSFSISDLMSNRAGILTDTQRRALRAERGDVLIIYGSFIAVVTLVLGAALSTLGNKQLALPYPDIRLACVIALIATSCHLFYLVGRLNTDLQRGVVHAIEGVVATVIPFADGRRHFLGRGYVQVNRTKFYCARDTLLAFERNAKYRLYYAPRSKVILSAEKV